MNRKLCFCLLIAFLAALPSLQAGTKEEIMRLQSDVLTLQNQIREVEKTFSERIDGLKSLVVQLSDAVGTSSTTLNKITALLEGQSSGVRSADQSVIQEIRNLSAKMDDSATRISALAQQLSELKVQYKALSQEESHPATPSPDTMYSQAMRDFVQGNFDLAIQEFTAYVNSYPGGDKAAAALCNLGESYRSQQKLPQAISAFTRVINDYPGTDSVASALYKRATIELAMQEKDNAIADLRNIVDKYPTAPEAGLAKADLEKIGVKPAKPAKKTGKAGATQVPLNGAVQQRENTMSSLNKIMLIGHLGKDPEIRYTPDGAAVATFSLATSESWTDKNGARQEHTEWHTVVAWSRLADLSKRFLSKGRQVYVEGRIRSREWNDRDGNKRRSTEVIATQMVLLGSRPQGADAGVQPMEPSGRGSVESEQPFGDAGITDSDIPF